MPAFGPVATTPIAAIPSTGGVTISVVGSLYSPATQNTVYVGSVFTGSGGTAPYTYTASWGTLVGLTINSSTGVVSGTVTSAPGSYGSITFTAADALSNSGTTSPFTMVVLAAGITQRSHRMERMRKFWWRPKTGPPPRRRKTIEYVPSSNLNVFKFNDYTVLSPPDDSLSVFKFNTYVVLEATPPRPLRRRRHPRPRPMWRWQRPHQHFAPTSSRVRPVLFTVT